MKNIFTPKEALPKPGERQFPIIIEHKGSKVRILEIPNREQRSFTVIYYIDGQRQRFTRREFEVAFKEGQQIALELGDGGGDCLPLMGNERRVYEHALDLLRPLALSLDQAAAEAVELRQRLNGAASPVEAVDYFVKVRPKAAPTITVQAVVKEFIQSREQEQVGPLYLRDLRNRLGAFAEAFQCPISLATPLTIDRYLNTLGVSARTRYNHRGTIGTLMNFAKERHYLPLDFSGLLRNGKKRKFVRDVIVFTPEEMALLLTAAKPGLERVCAQ